MDVQNTGGSTGTRRRVANTPMTTEPAPDVLETTVPVAVEYTQQAHDAMLQRVSEHEHTAECFSQWFVPIHDHKGTPVMGKDGKQMMMDVGVHHLAKCLFAIGMLTPIDPHSTTPAISLCGDMSCAKCSKWAEFLEVPRG